MIRILLFLTILSLSLSAFVPIKKPEPRGWISGTKLYNLTDTNMDYYIQPANNGLPPHHRWFIMLYNHDCPETKKIFPEFKILSNVTRILNVGVVDVDNSPIIKARYPISKSPSFIFLDNDANYYEYEGENTVEAWTQFFQNNGTFQNTDPIPAIYENDLNLIKVMQLRNKVEVLARRIGVHSFMDKIIKEQGWYPEFNKFAKEHEVRVQSLVWAALGAEIFLIGFFLTLFWCCCGERASDRVHEVKEQVKAKKEEAKGKKEEVKAKKEDAKTKKEEIKEAVKQKKKN